MVERTLQERSDLIHDAKRMIAFYIKYDFRIINPEHNGLAFYRKRLESLLEEDKAYWKAKNQAAI